MTEQPARYQRSFSGMIGALIVLVAIVIAVVGLQVLNRPDTADPAPPVDYLSAADYAATQADFTLAVPSRLPEGWTATSVSFTPGADQSWHLGMLTDTQRYVGVEQAKASARAMAESHVDPQAVQGADVTIDGITWQTWTDSGGDTALVRETPEVTTLVVGTVGLDDLEAFVALLPRASFVGSSA